jgi:serine/threonine protein kinase
MPEDIPPTGLTPTNYQRTAGGKLQWQPPTPEHLAAMLPQYEIECLLGRGGMGAVYKGRQKSLDRTVAIKILPPEAAGDEDANYVERFKNEARTMAKMNHPGIVHVYDFGETSEGQLYIVMEFIDGTDVSKMILSQGKLPPEHALAITAHVCDALFYAHKQNVIHRDIKPANIMINMEGTVKVADFGLAKANDPTQSGLTKTNMAMGTPDFVAPEALTPGMTVDGRADLYAVGVMLYQMLTGSIPRGMWAMPSAMLKTDPRFDAIISRSMQTDREARYQSAVEIRRDLDVILTTPQATPQPAQKPAAPAPGRRVSQNAEPPPPSKSAQPSAPAKKSKTPLLIGLGAAAALALGAFFMSSGSRQTSEKSSPASTAPLSQAPAKAPEEPAASKPKPTPTPAKSASIPPGWTDLLATADVARDVIRGQWAMTAEGLHCAHGGSMEYFQLNYTPPEEYDFQIEFTVFNKDLKKGGTHNSVSQMIVVPGHQFALLMNSTGSYLGSILDGKEFRAPDRTEALSLEAKYETARRMSVKVEVRRGKVRALINDKEAISWSGDFKRLKWHTKYIERDMTRLAVACQNAEVVFHSLMVRAAGAESAETAKEKMPGK